MVSIPVYLTRIRPKSSKNFRTVGITCHTVAVWIPVWTTCGQVSNYQPSRTQLRRSPQCLQGAPPIVHNPLTTRHTCHAGPTLGYPQSPQALILLLVYLRSLSLEEGAWGHIDPRGATPLCNLRCHPVRLAFKLSRKALRWFSDSHYGPWYASARRVLRYREIAG
jgi:hypothetical protein